MPKQTASDVDFEVEEDSGTKLIIPKHEATLDEIKAALSVYAKSPKEEWVENSEYKLALKQLLGSEEYASSYTKKSQVPAYYGFTEWEDIAKDQSRRRITAPGRSFYSAIVSNNMERAFDCLVSSMETISFGFGNFGAPHSQSVVNPPNALIRAILRLGGISLSEFALLMWRTSEELVPYEYVLRELEAIQLSGASVFRPEKSNKWKDPKPITSLKYWGFLDEDSQGRLIISKNVLFKYGERLRRLPIYNKLLLEELFSRWLKKAGYKGSDKNYPRSIKAVSEVYSGIKNTSVFDGIFERLEGSPPSKKIFEVNGIAEFESVYSHFSEFMKRKGNPDHGDWDAARYSECYDYALKSDCTDKGRLYNAYQAYVQFLKWWEKNKKDFGFKEDAMYNGDIGPIQQIFYGAPGTGKSWKVDEIVKNPAIKAYRTTFHPDSDYSTFVGAYKPTMKTEQRVVYINDGKTAQLVENGPDTLKYEKKISYEFRPQAFMNAYVAAWKNPDKPVVLVVEEINRGNCAQIFGDLFQLLDRNDENGYSAYPIDADTDLAKWLSSDEEDGTGQLLRFGKDGLGLSKPVDLNMRDDDWADVMKGKKLALPPNLYIWATMNTSDQSLFPIDSAFKRRWDWKYVPIREGKFKDGPKQGQSMKWKIAFTVPKHKDGENEVLRKDCVFDWWAFLNQINTLIFDQTQSEDKELGYFFVKPDGKLRIGEEYYDTISAGRFVGKVIFYLWNDVFKDIGIETIFHDDAKNKEEGAKGVQFQKFFNDENDEVNCLMLRKFFSAIQLAPEKDIPVAENATDVVDNNTSNVESQTSTPES